MDAALQVWPENNKVFEVFSAMRNQWVRGMDGRECLRLEVLPRVLIGLRMPAETEAEIFADLLEMEAAALELFAEQNKKP